MHRHNLELVFKLMRLHSNCKDQPDACIITDGHGHVVGTGTASITRPAKFKDCGCMGYCRSSHAVTRAVAACGSHIKRARTCYSAHAPCPDCINLLTSTPIEEIVFAIDEPNSPSEMLWLRHGKVWTHHPIPLGSNLKDIDDD